MLSAKCSEDHVILATLVPTSLINCIIFLTPQHVTVSLIKLMQLISLLFEMF